MSHPHSEPRPWRRIAALLSEDWRDLGVLLAYTLSVGLMGLAVPLTAKALVGTVASGLLTQPLIALSVALLAALAFMGLLRAMQLWLVEIVQARLFARTSLRLAQRIPRAPLDAWHGVYAPELVNRFFDVLVVQKSWAKLLVDGPAAAAQVLVGVLLMAAYSPLLLGLSLLLVAGAAAIALLGRGALSASLEESARKYEVAHWLEDIAACQAGLKMHASPRLAADRADALVSEYLLARRRHFRVLLRQHAAYYGLHAAALTAVFAVGGWLVVQRKLGLGQLVAAEIVVLMTVGALDKLVGLLEPLYDLLTALEKVALVEELPLERRGGRSLPEREGGMAISCRAVRFAYPGRSPVLEGVDMEVPSGARVSIVGHSGVGKTTLTRLLCGLLEPVAGEILADGVPLREADLDALRARVAIVGEESEIFAGSIRENILLGREVPAEDLDEALEATLLKPILERLPGGLDHALVSQGKNLSLGQRQRVLVARAIVARPRLLLLDETLTGIGESNKLRILDSLLDPARPWTVIDVSHDAEVVARSGDVFVLSDGRIVERGSPRALAADHGSTLRGLFPELVRQFGKEAA